MFVDNSMPEEQESDREWITDVPDLLNPAVETEGSQRIPVYDIDPAKPSCHLVIERPKGKKQVWITIEADGQDPLPPVIAQIQKAVGGSVFLLDLEPFLDRSYPENRLTIYKLLEASFSSTNKDNPSMIDQNNAIVPTPDTSGETKDASKESSPREKLLGDLIVKLNEITERFDKNEVTVDNWKALRSGLSFATMQASRGGEKGKKVAGAASLYFLPSKIFTQEAFDKDIADLEEKCKQKGLDPATAFLVREFLVEGGEKKYQVYLHPDAAVTLGESKSDKLSSQAESLKVEEFIRKANTLLERFKNFEQEHQEDIKKASQEKVRISDTQRIKELEAQITQLEKENRLFKALGEDTIKELPRILYEIDQTGKLKEKAQRIYDGQVQELKGRYGELTGLAATFIMQKLLEHLVKGK